MHKKRYVPALVALAMLSLTAVAFPKPAMAAERIVDIPTNWTRYQVLEGEIYMVQAGAGAFRVVVSDIPANDVVRVRLEDPQTSEVLLDKKLQQPADVAEVHLSKGGVYRLMVAPNLAGAVTLHGEDLSVSAEAPAIHLPAMQVFETRNEPFVTIDPATMQDGLYVLTVVGTAKTSDADISGEPAPFPDFDQVPGWARPSVALLAKAGWLKGYPDGQFHPDGNLERDETAKVVGKFLGL
jgi:hypothetical protein